MDQVQRINGFHDAVFERATLDQDHIELQFFVKRGALRKSLFVVHPLVFEWSLTQHPQKIVAWVEIEKITQEMASQYTGLFANKFSNLQDIDIIEKIYFSVEFHVGMSIFGICDRVYAE